jgi:hypothetical protein
MGSRIVVFIAGLLFGVALMAPPRSTQAEPTNTITILEDFTPLQGQINGPMLMQPQQDGHLIGNVTPRWAIAGKVSPMIYGDRSGALYFYFNPSTRLRESGFFVPKNPINPIPPELLAQTMERVAPTCGSEGKRWTPRADGNCYAEDAPH